jgi:1,4-alpha-glucan branching enzyme
MIKTPHQPNPQQEAYVLKKKYSIDRNTCRVTFKLPPEVNAQSSHLCGSFTEWEKSCQPMKRLKDGSFSISVSLEAGEEYHFRYLLDGDRWENDWVADAYVPNPFGTEDSVVKV